MNAQVQAIYPDHDAQALQADIRRVFALQQDRALALRESTAAERIAKIRKLRDALLERRDDVLKAMAADFGKPEVEVDLTELMIVAAEANDAIRHLKRWMKPRKVGATKALLGTSSRITYEPKGVALIIAPWNFPVNLLLGPLVSAIAAGNTAMLKPSELTPATSRLMAELLHGLFDESEVRVFEGEVEVSTALLDLPFDHCFFTGSPAVGRIVMSACAKHLTSVTLELGGKSPVIIDASANIANAAKSIAFGKCSNAGQVCIAPDYVLVHESVHDRFVAEYDKIIAKRYGATIEARRNSADIARIVNPRHHERISALIDDAVERGAVVSVGGDRDEQTRFIAPTLLTNVPADARIMEEEIFGPALPVLRYRTLDEAIALINSKPKPLALYIYARDEQVIRRSLRQTSAGDSGINTCVVHFMHHKLPFGGVNNSGIGKAHGEHGFKAFSHERSVLRDRFAATMLFAPPYTSLVKRLARWAVRLLS